MKKINLFLLFCLVILSLQLNAQDTITNPVQYDTKLYENLSIKDKSIVYISRRSTYACIIHPAIEIYKNDSLYDFIIQPNKTYSILILDPGEYTFVTYEIPTEGGMFFSDWYFHGYNFEINENRKRSNSFTFEKNRTYSLELKPKPGAWSSLWNLKHNLNSHKIFKNDLYYMNNNAFKYFARYVNIELLDAVYRNDVTKADSLIRNGHDINCHASTFEVLITKPFWDHNSILPVKEVKFNYINQTVKINNKMLIELLSEYEIQKKLVTSINTGIIPAEVQYGYTPLAISIENNNIEMFDFLIANGADVNKQFKVELFKYPLFTLHKIMNFIDLFNAKYYKLKNKRKQAIYEVKGLGNGKEFLITYDSNDSLCSPADSADVYFNSYTITPLFLAIVTSKGDNYYIIEKLAKLSDKSLYDNVFDEIEINDENIKSILMKNEYQ